MCVCVCVCGYTYVDRSVSVYVCFPSYRSRNEIKEVKRERDPIKLLHSKIVEADLATQEELKVCVFLLCAWFLLLHG